MLNWRFFCFYYLKINQKTNTHLETSQSNNTTCLAERLNKIKVHLQYITLSAILLKGMIWLLYKGEFGPVLANTSIVNSYTCSCWSCWFGTLSFDERMLTVSSIKKVQTRTLEAARIEGRRWWSWWNLRVCLRESSGWHLGCTGYLRWGTASGFLGNRRSWIRSEHEEEEEEGVIRKTGGGKSHEYATEKVLKEYKWNLLITGIWVRVLGLYIVKWYVYFTLYSLFISCIFTYIIHI